MSDSMRVGIVGSRNYRELESVRVFVRGLAKGTEVISGGARGVDETAVSVARECGLSVKIFFPDWSRGRGAGLARNQQIVNESDIIVAFWDGKSRGTADTVRRAKAAGKPVEVFS